MKTINGPIWKQCREDNQDGCGKGCVDYAERWADMMEARMAAGEVLEDIAEQTSQDASAGHITRFQHSAAVFLLSKVWEHGERLRRWHNVNVQVSQEGERANEEGGVLNPDLLSAGNRLFGRETRERVPGAEHRKIAWNPAF